MDDAFSGFINSLDDGWDDEAQLDLRFRFRGDSARDAAFMQATSQLRQLAARDKSGMFSLAVDNAVELADVLAQEMDALILPHMWAEESGGTVADFLRQATDEYRDTDGIADRFHSLIRSYEQSREVMRRATARMSQTALPDYGSVVDEMLSMRYNVGYRQAMLLLSLLPSMPDFAADAFVANMSGDNLLPLLVRRIVRVQNDMLDAFVVAVREALGGD